MLTQVQSLIRTYVALAVGVLVTALSSVGVHLSTSTQAALLVVTTGVASALYATVVHLVELRWPSLGKLLGSVLQEPVTASTVAPPSMTTEAAQVPAPSTEPPTVSAQGAPPNSTASAG